MISFAHPPFQTHAEEVDFDIHDDPALNRIQIGENNKLIIKDLQPGDEGEYHVISLIKVSGGESNRWEFFWALI